MLTRQAYRYGLKPDNKQRTLLAKHAGAACFGGKLRLWRHLRRRNPSTNFGGVYGPWVIETGSRYQIYPWDIWANSMERSSIYGNNGLLSGDSEHLSIPLSADNFKQPHFFKTVCEFLDFPYRFSHQLSQLSVGKR